MIASNPAVAPAALIATALCLSLVGGCGGRAADPGERVERDSGLLQAEPGFRGDRLGVEVERVTETEDGRLEIDLHLPLQADMVDEVEVLGPRGRPLDLGKEPQIRPDDDERGVGLRLFVPKSSNLEFRLRLIDLPET